jgi:adenylate cyclase
VTLKLEAIEGPTAGESQTITGITVIGRDPQSGVVIPAQTVSREHAVVRPDDSGPGFVIEDLDSRSGTFVNGVRTRRAVLLEGDRIQIGPAVFTVGLREDALSGQVDPAGILEDASPSPRLQTLRLSIDALAFKLRARDLESGGAHAALPGAAAPAPAPEAAAAPGRAHTPAPPPETPAERLEAIIELSHALAATHDPARVVREVARRLLSLFPQAKRVGIFDTGEDPTKNDLVVRILVDREAHASASPRTARVSRAIVTEAVAQKQAILSADVSRDPRFLVSSSASEVGARSVVCAPLCVGDRVLGALYLESVEGTRPYDEGALRFLAGIATVVATAAENARLFARIQAETSRRAALERYFSPDFVERVLSGEVPLARDGDVRHGTILFTDIRGFTALTSTTEPKTLVATLNAYFEAMQRIIFRGRGTVERFGGDSILAYWGVMEQDPHGPRRAALAALAMQNELFRLNRELAMTGKPVIEIGIGVNTGDVIAGNVGSAERYEFTILGDAINLARRIEDLAGPGEVLLGETTHAEIGADALVRMLPPRAVKGRAHPVALAALLGIKAEDPGKASLRYDLALGARMTVEHGGHGEARLLGLDVARNGGVSVQVLTALDLLPQGRVALSITLPTGARARDHRGLTAELARPVELVGRVEASGEMKDTMPPMALQRALAQAQSGLELVSVKLEDARPLGVALGLTPA